MKPFLIIISIALTSFFNGFSQAKYEIPKHVEKILFLGNSITYQGDYITYLEAYLSLKYPNKRYQFINVGLSSETVSGLSEPNHANSRFPRPDLHERLDRILNKVKPDLVFACYGMNDGIYMPFDDLRYMSFKKGIEWMHNRITSEKIPIIHLTPSVYDIRKGKAYHNVISIYSNWLLSKQYTAGWDVIDLHWPMQNYLERERRTNANFVLARDGVHPNKIGHWLMAKQILLYLGELDVANNYNAENVFNNLENGTSVLKLIDERQNLMKHAWLSYTQHKRPGIKKGLPLKEAQLKAKAIDRKILTLLN